MLLTGSKDPDYAKKLASEIERQNGTTFPYEDLEIPLSLYILTSTLEKEVRGGTGEMFGQFHQTISEFKKTLIFPTQA